MGVCLRCQNVGVKDTFYGKGKQYCSANCVRGLPPQPPQTPLFKIVTLPATKPKIISKTNVNVTPNQVLTPAPIHALSGSQQMPAQMKKKPQPIKVTQSNISSAKKSPKNVTKAGGHYCFDWISIVADSSMRGAPISSFPHAPMSDTWESLVTIGLKLEVKNRDFPSSKPNQEFHWIASVVKIAGLPPLLALESLYGINGVFD